MQKKVQTIRTFQYTLGKVLKQHDRIIGNMKVEEARQGDRHHTLLWYSRYREEEVYSLGANSQSRPEGVAQLVFPEAGSWCWRGTRELGDQVGVDRLWGQAGVVR